MKTTRSRTGLVFDDDVMKKRYTASMKLLIVLSSAVCCVVLGICPVWAMTSTHYTIPWDSVSSGGNEMGTSTNFLLYDTVGQPASGSSTSTHFSIEAGYRSGTAPFALALDMAGQRLTPAPRYSTFANGGSNYVAVSSDAGFSLGDYIVVVQDPGYTELTAIGRIVGISSNTLSVDRWDGDAGLMDASPSGDNDLVYLLNANSVPFGTIAAGSERVAVAGGSVFSSASSGHTVYVQANGNLTLVGGGTSIANVADGTVSSNAEEYGAEAIGPHALSSGTDVAVTSTQRAIVSTTVPAILTPDRFILLFKLGVTAGTEPGDYTQTVYFTLTSNF